MELVEELPEKLREDASVRTIRAIVACFKGELTLPVARTPDTEHLASNAAFLSNGTNLRRPNSPGGGSWVPGPADQDLEGRSYRASNSCRLPSRANSVPASEVGGGTGGRAVLLSWNAHLRWAVRSSTRCQLPSRFLWRDNGQKVIMLKDGRPDPRPPVIKAPLGDTMAPVGETPRVPILERNNNDI